MSDVFLNMPDISQADIEAIENSFKNYLFYKYVKQGVRDYVCTACGKHFKRGVQVQLRTTTRNDIELEKAKNGDVLQCPCCDRFLEVRKLSHHQLRETQVGNGLLIVLPKDENEVWFRGVHFFRRFNDKGIRQISSIEYCRYKLNRGNARMWTLGWYTDAFCETSQVYAYDYTLYYPEGVSLEKTFLKNTGYEAYVQGCGTPSFIKYMSWYARHPQVEMLAKMGHFEVIKEMLNGNTDNKRLLDWNAKKPWDFFRLTHQEYNEYVKRGCDLDLLKTFRRIKCCGFKDFEKAEKLNKFFSRHWYGIKHSDIRSLQSMAKREGKNAYDALKYFEKISRESVGGCHMHPGITAKEAYNLWADYIGMLKEKNPKLDNVQLFPHDLKARHDELLKEKNRKLAKDRVKQEKEYIKSLVKKYKKFDKVNKICEEIKDKYTYSNAEYSIVVPQGIEEIIKESVALNMCIHRVENGRYFDRIQRRETYLFFLRENKHSKSPWYIIEAEPNGTVQQKRTENDSQYEEDIKSFTPFLREWQSQLQNKLTKSDYKLSAVSKKLREENFEDLRKTKKQVNYGNHRGELLIDLLENDLLEVIAS